ncbi:hypothetical protein R1flu_028219 [Riccia fluitans]|uniref:Uncharacterized protein n=1 Tax=Riccia fluitans TaxID=41844 RepID=A0ABD1XNX0_9MARC
MVQKKVAIVTGANTGIGRETALELARKGLKVFLACRDLDRGRHAVNYILDTCPGADVELLQLDLQNLESVRRCASEFKSRKLPLNILVNNAGLNGKTGSSYSPEGIHVVPQVNFLGPYTFTRLLEDNLTLGAPSRVVNVSSIMHRLAEKFSPDDYFTNRKHGVYRNSKLANVLFTHEAQLRWQGKGIESSAVDPGSVSSDIFRADSSPVRLVVKAFYAPTWDGAKIVLHAATAPYASDKKDSKPFRFFARGAFASPVITATPPALLSYPQAVVMALASIIDWPVRRLSGRTLWSEVKEVPAHKQAYDRELSKQLWNKAAVLAGFETQ